MPKSTGWLSEGTLSAWSRLPAGIKAHPRPALCTAHVQLEFSSRGKSPTARCEQKSCLGAENWRGLGLNHGPVPLGLLMRLSWDFQVSFRMIFRWPGLVGGVRLQANPESTAMAWGWLLCHNLREMTRASQIWLKPRIGIRSFLVKWRDNAGLPVLAMSCCLTLPHARQKNTLISEACVQLNGLHFVTRWFF